MTATKAELARIMEVMAAAFAPEFGEAWNERQVESALLIPGTRFALIDAAGVIGPPSSRLPTAGFYLVRQTVDEEELMLIGVVPEYRRHGLASRLLQHLIAAASERGSLRLFLEMRADNPASHFYDAFGFERIGTRKQYYRGADGIMRDANTMALDLPDIKYA